MRVSLAPIIVLVGCIAWPTSVVHGQMTTGQVALNQFEPTPAGDALFAVPSPLIGGHLTPQTFVIADYSHAPFVLPPSLGTEGALVGSQMFLHVGLSLALWDRLLVSLLLPAAIAQSGDSPTLGTDVFLSPSSAALGDVRFGARIRLFGGDTDPFQVSAGVYIHIPTSPLNTFTGEGELRNSPHILLGGRFNRFVWSAAGGFVIRRSGHSSTITYAAGAAALFAEDRVQIGAEIFASTPLESGQILIGHDLFIDRRTTTNAELLASARVRPIGSFTLGAAAGPGLSSALGTPTFRVLGSVAWMPPPPAPPQEPPADTDADGLLDSADACPYAFGPKTADPRRSGCPVYDLDDDGVADPDDACPNVRGSARAEPANTRNGCPEK